MEASSLRLAKISLINRFLQRFSYGGFPFSSLSLRNPG
jgi:hypothetical protein